MSEEDGDTISRALKIIRNSCCHWSPRYILSDQSSIEAKSIRIAFSGVDAGEQQCEVILCIIHIRIIKIYEKSLRHFYRHIDIFLFFQITITNLLEFYYNKLKKLLFLTFEHKVHKIILLCFKQTL